MKQSAIIAAAAVAFAPAIDLFEITTHIEDNRTKGGDKRPHGVPRVANHSEILAYGRFLAASADLCRFESALVLGDGKGVTFGKCTKGGGYEDATRLCYVTFTEKTERVYVPAQFETGAYSVPFPGRNGPGAVTLEIVDDAGDVISSQSLPVEPKKHGIAWDKDAVRAAVGPVQRPARARKARAATVEPPAVPNAPETGAEAAGEAIGALFAAMSDRIAALEAALLTRNESQSDSKRVEPEPETRNDVPAEPAGRARQDQRNRLAAKLREMRRVAALDRSALAEGARILGERDAKILKLDRQIEDYIFTVGELSTRLAAAELAAKEAATIYEPQLDAKQQRIVALENELIELKSGGRIKLGPQPVKVTPSVIVFPRAANA